MLEVLYVNPAGSPLSQDATNPGCEIDCHTCHARLAPCFDTNTRQVAGGLQRAGEDVGCCSAGEHLAHVVASNVDLPPGRKTPFVVDGKSSTVGLAPLANRG